MYTVKINLPFVTSYPDYHELDWFCSDLKSVSRDQKLKFSEVSVPFDRQYWGVYYKGARPTISRVRFMIEHKFAGTISKEELLQIDYS